MRILTRQGTPAAAACFRLAWPRWRGWAGSLSTGALRPPIFRRYRCAGLSPVAAHRHRRKRRRSEKFSGRRQTPGQCAQTRRHQSRLRRKNRGQRPGASLPPSAGNTTCRPGLPGTGEREWANGRGGRAETDDRGGRGHHRRPGRETAFPSAPATHKWRAKSGLPVEAALNSKNGQINHSPPQSFNLSTKPRCCARLSTESMDKAVDKPCIAARRLQPGPAIAEHGRHCTNSERKRTVFPFLCNLRTDKPWRIDHFFPDEPQGNQI